MAKLVYSAIASLNGYVADGDGDFDWAVPDEEVHAFINDLQRTIGTHLTVRKRTAKRMPSLFTQPRRRAFSELLTEGVPRSSGQR